jgi:hypothetical protein
VALIPLAMLVFGFGVRKELSVVAFATFWPMLILTQAAARQVEPRLLEVSAALGLSAWQRTKWIVLPAMIPRLFVALRLGVAVALVVAVTVEIAANPHGMGYAMMIAQQSMEPARMLAWLFWIGVVGMLINAAALRLRAVARRMGAAGEPFAHVVDRLARLGRRVARARRLWWAASHGGGSTACSCRRPKQPEVWKKDWAVASCGPSRSPRRHMFEVVLASVSASRSAR